MFIRWNRAFFPSKSSLVINHCSRGLTTDIRARHASSFLRITRALGAKSKWCEKCDRYSFRSLTFTSTRVPRAIIWSMGDLRDYSLTRVLETNGLSFSRSHTMLRPESCVIHARTHHTHTRATLRWNMLKYVCDRQKTLFSRKPKETHHSPLEEGGRKGNGSMPSVVGCSKLISRDNRAKIKHIKQF